MGVGLYVYPRFAVHITTGQSVPIERLRAYPLWHPSVGMDGRMVSGHVLYVSQALHEAMMEVALGVSESWEAEVEVERGEEDIAHRLAAPIYASRFASIPQLVHAIADRTRAALPVTKRKVLRPIAPDATPAEILVDLEAALHKEGLHVLVPLSVGRRYQLFTDATEALLPVSPLTLGRAPRLCFVLLSTDDLIEKRAGSPWLRQAAELMVLPINAVRIPEAVGFIGDLLPLRGALLDEHLMGELATTVQEVTGGWPDLCDRFYGTLGQLRDVDALRERLQRLLALLRAAEEDPTRGDELLALSLGGADIDLADLRQFQSLSEKKSDGGHGGEDRDTLLDVLHRPRPFTWEQHGRGYLDGVLGRERGTAVPRSRVIEVALRGRLLAGKSAHTPPVRGSTPPVRGTEAASRPAGALSVRWLHVSDFHFSQHSDGASAIVLQALLATVAELRQRGRELDLIFVTGDIANTGAEGEYLLAEAYLGELCQVAGVPRSALHMVPGNHDVNRPAGDGLARTLPDAEAAQRYFQPGAHRHHLLKLEAFRAFYNRFYAGEPRKDARDDKAPRAAAPGQATAGAEIVLVRDLDIGVLPLNTAWFAQDDGDSGKLMVGEALVRAGLAAIAGATVRLSLMHHPISDLSPIERKLIQERVSESCHFLLRGHLHDTEAQWISTPYQQTIVLAAGAAYQGRTRYQNRALYVETDVEAAQKRPPEKLADKLPEKRHAWVHPYPIRYELTGHDRWTLDTSVFPKSYPTYLETLPLVL